MDVYTKVRTRRVRPLKQWRSVVGLTGHFSASGESGTDRNFTVRMKSLRAAPLGPNHLEKQRDGREQLIRNLVAELARARRDERQKIASDLHDHIGQNLILALMKLGLFQSSIEQKKVSLIEEVRQLIKEVLEETRGLVSDLSPPALRDLEFEAALDWLVQHVRARYGLNCEAVVISITRSLTKSLQEALLQSVRELLINVAKHAQAKQARVIVRSQDGKVIAQVADNGRGFDPYANAKPKGGFGLLSVRERLTNLGGDVTIDSRAGKGATVTLILPIGN